MGEGADMFQTLSQSEKAPNMSRNPPPSEVAPRCAAPAASVAAGAMRGTP